MDLRYKPVHRWFMPFILFSEFHWQKQETAKVGMAGLQSSNIIWEDPPRTNVNTKVYITYCMTLNGQIQGHK